MELADEARCLLARFAERARDALLSDGWQRGPESAEIGDSIFLGNFQRPLAPDFLATLQLIRESGPIIRGLERRPIRGVVRTDRIAASVGDELGVRHLATERHFAVLHLSCEADISIDLADFLEERGVESPRFTDGASADMACRVLVGAVAAHALPFAREHADVDRMVQFVRDGGQPARVEMFEYIFVPTLLAASGRTAEARAAVADHQTRIPLGRAEEKESSTFRDLLSGRLG